MRPSWRQVCVAAFAAVLMVGHSLSQDDADVRPVDEDEALPLIEVTEDEFGAPLSSLMEEPPASPLFDMREGDTVPVICPFKGNIDYEPGEISCGLLAVRENREVAESRLIQLLYVRLHARGEDEAARREDPVVYLTGGPGVSATPYVERFVDHAIIQTRDLYILQQRGIGQSGEFCPLYDSEEPALNVGRTLAEQEEFARRRLARCFDRARAEGVDLAAYNTVENARDVRVLREALGFEQWNVWGISYGSHLGQMLTRVDPQGIRALVIDAIVPNDLENLMRIHRWAARVLDNIVRTCEADASCARAYPDLEARTFAAMASLQENPITVTVSDTETFPGGEVVIGGQAIAFAPFMMMYEQETYPGLAAVLHALVRAAERRDETVFTALALGSAGGGGNVSAGMSAAVSCNDGYIWHSAQIIAEDLAEVPVLAGLIGSVEGAAADQALCERYGMGLRDRADYAPVSFDGPALIVNGAWDPITPTDLAIQIMPGFAYGQYLEVPFAGHGPTRSDECTAGVMIAFFDDPAAGLDTACVETANLEPRFVQPLTSRFVAQALVGWEENRGPFLGFISWGAISAMILGIALIIFPVSFALRRIDGAQSVNTGGARAISVAAAALGAGGMIVLAYSAYLTSEISPVLLLAGFAGPAHFGAWAVLLGGLAGIAALFLVAGARLSSGKMAFGTLAGIVVTALAAVSLAIFAAFADLAPF